MGSLTSLDGTFEKTLTSATDISGLPAIIQKYMAAGVSGNKLTFTKLFDENSIEKTGGLENVVAQLSVLDEKQQQAFINLSDFNGELKKTIQNLLLATKQGEKFNSKLFEQEASKNDKLSKGVLNEVMQTTGMKDADGNYLLTNTKDVCNLLEQYANDANNAQKAQELFNAGLLEQSDNGYKVSASLLKLIGAKKSDIVTTGIATAGQMAWNYAMQIGKQLLLSFGVAAVTFIATKLVDYIMNLKTRSEELVATMNDSHDAAQQATKDVEEIQSKIDELNKSLKDAGVDKIEDIVDPAERERLQAINDMLQAQLELKKQLEKDAADKANADTSAVVNDKTEDSIVKTRTVNVSYAEGGASAGTHQVAEKISKTKSLQEHTAALNELVDKRRELATAGKEYTQEYKDNEAAITSETEKIRTLSAAVSENMNGYETDADSFAQYKDEYVAGTNAMTVATKALANAQDDTGVDTTNVDIFAEKVGVVKASMSRRGTKDSKGNAYVGAVNEFSGMTGEAVLNIDADTEHQTEAESNALKILHETADKAHISFEALIGVFEQFGFLQVSNSEAANNYASQLEETMSVIDNIQSAYKACSSAVEEYNQYGYMSVDSLQTLLQMDDQYLNALELVNGKLQVNQSAYADLLATQYAEAQMEAISQAISELNAIAKGDAAEKAETFTEATEDEKNKLTALCPALKDATVGTGELAAALAAAQGAADGEDADAIQAKIDGVMNALNTKLTLLHDNMSAAINNGNALSNQLGGFSNSTKSASKSVSDAASAFDTLSKAMKEYNQYGYICADTMKSLAGLEDKYTSCLTKQNGKLVLNTAQFRKFIKAQLEEANAADDGGKSAGELNKILDWLNSSVDSETISFEQLTDAIKGYGTAMDEAKEKTDAIKSAFSGLYEVMNNKTDRSNPFGLLDSDDVEKQHEALLQLAKDTDVFKSEAYNPETGEVDFNSKAFKDSVVEYLNGMADAAAQTGGAGAKAIEKNWRDAANAIAEGKISVEEFYNGLGSSLDKATKEIDDFQSAFSDIGDIVKEYNLYGGLSIDNYQKLMTLSPDYLSCLKLEGNQLVFNEAAYKQLLIDKLDDMIKTYRQADATQELADRLEELRDGLKGSKASFTGATDAAKNFEDTLSNIKSLLTDLVGVFEQVNTDKSNDLKIQGDAWLEVIDKRIDALNEQSDAQERAIELQKAQDALDKAKANKTVHVYHAGGSGFEWEADQNAVRDAQSTLNDTIRKNRKEDEIERLNKLKEAVQKNNELIGSSFEDYEKKKKYLAEFDKMTYDEMIKYNDEWKDSILGNMKSTQAVTNVNDTITKIEKLISTLETLNNVLKALDTGFASTDGGGLTGLFSNGGILSKIGKFFNIASEDGLGAAINKTGEWFTGKVTTALEANPNNPIIKAFSNIWTKVGEGAGTFFSGTSGTGLGGIVKTGIEKVSTWLGKLGGSEGLIGQAVTKGSSFLAKLGIGGSATTAAATGTAETVGAVGATTVGTAATSASSGIPIIGPLIAVAVNNAVQQFGKISKENTKIWADENSSTGEKIVKSVGNVLYHLSPVEGWDKSLQYAKAAAEGDNIWDKFKNGAKSLYYGCGLGVVVDNIFSTVKSILGVFGIKFKDTDSSSSDSTASSSEKKKWYESKIFFWNWGKKAKGDKKIRNAGPYNVDEQGEEIIVHKPQTGRMTYLEKGDGVVPANETANLMAIGKNPTGWASGIFNNLLGSKLFGIADLIQKAIANGAKKTFKEFGKGTSSDISDLVDKAKEKTLSQIRDMTDAMSDAWKSVADETGVSQDKIEATSSEIFNRMQKLAEQTYSAINDNAGMSAEQVETVSEQLFEALQSIYTSGWNDIYATSDKMSEETASLLNSAYSGSAASCKKSMSSISSILKSSWSKCGGGTKNLANNTYKTLSKAWADTSQDAQKMMYDVRACFDTSWGAVEQGTSDLANGTESTLTDAWTSISSKSSEVFGPNGSLQQDADKSWSNVDPGATNLSDNMAWVMDQSYKSMKSGCAEAIDDVKQQVNAAADEFKATASQTENQATEPAKEPEVKKEPEKKKNIIEKAWDATVDAVEYVANSVSDFFSGLFGHASGLKSASSSHFANVDELGPELLVRKPQSGRYTYLETGDGVVPADITSRLFEMGGNPDRWFQNQMSKYGSQSIAAKSAGSMSFSTGDIIIQNPVGSADDLATQIEREMPNKMAQAWNKR